MKKHYYCLLSIKTIEELDQNLIDELKQQLIEIVNPIQFRFSQKKRLTRSLLDISVKLFNPEINDIFQSVFLMEVSQIDKDFKDRYDKFAVYLKHLIGNIIFEDTFVGYENPRDIIASIDRVNKERGNIEDKELKKLAEVFDPLIYMANDLRDITKGIVESGEWYEREE